MDYERMWNQLKQNLEDSIKSKNSRLDKATISVIKASMSMIEALETK